MAAQRAANLRGNARTATLRDKHQIAAFVRNSGTTPVMVDIVRNIDRRYGVQVAVKRLPWPSRGTSVHYGQEVTTVQGVADDVATRIESGLALML